MSVRRALSRLNGVDWAQLHSKLAAAAWAVALFVFTPNVVAASLGTVLVWILTGFVLVGAIVSSVGLIIAARDHETDPVAVRCSLRRSLRGLGIELVGLTGMLTGVVLYFLTQLVLSFGPDGDQRWALTVLAYFLGSMVIGRIVSVVHRRRKELGVAAALGGTS